VARPTTPEEAKALGVRLRELFSYDPITGNFIRLVTCRGKGIAGRVAGSTYSKGYRYIGIDGKDYRLCHLAWLWMTGEWLETEIDHRDRNPSNDAWSNLRSATRSQNLTNRRVMSNNLLGVKGVSRGRSGKYFAAVYVNRKAVRLGAYDNVDAAAAAVRAGGVKYHGEYYHAD
jgi:hypothetical protein